MDMRLYIISYTFEVCRMGDQMKKGPSSSRQSWLACSMYKTLPGRLSVFHKELGLRTFQVWRTLNIECTPQQTSLNFYIQKLQQQDRRDIWNTCRDRRRIYPTKRKDRSTVITYLNVLLTSRDHENETVQCVLDNCRTGKKGGDDDCKSLPNYYRMIM